MTGCIAIDAFGVQHTHMQILVPVRPSGNDFYEGRGGVNRWNQGFARACQDLPGYYSARR